MLPAPLSPQLRFRVTWERVTPESAEHGDADSRGFVEALEPEGFTLREALEAIESESPARASLSCVEASDSVASGARLVRLLCN